MFTEDCVQSNLASNKPLVFIAWRTSSITKSHYDQLESFVKCNPQFSFYFFDDKLQDIWMLHNFSKSTLLKAYNSSSFGACKSDIFRYCLIWTYGGIFASINYLPTCPLSEFLPLALDTFVVSPSSLGYKSPFATNTHIADIEGKAIAQFWICSVKGHPILELALSLIVERFNSFCNVSFKEVDRAIWFLTGPFLLTDAIHKFLAQTEWPKTQVTLLGEDFSGRVRRSKKANYRYIFAPSYIGFRNSTIFSSHITVTD
jgi:mannosyltransferase OCH1-like enzyme